VEIRRAALGREEAQTEYLSASGTLQFIEAGDISETLASVTELVNVDANVQAVINRVSRQLRFNLDALHATAKSNEAGSQQTSSGQTKKSPTAKTPEPPPDNAETAPEYD
jgi:hypothetical protein